MRRRLEQLEAYILSIIEGRRRDKAALAIGGLLRLLSYVFGSVVQLRLFMYSSGILRPHTLGCQVISIGNLTVGGTGKTPIVEVFARNLQKSGRKVAILSRGYKKDEKPWIERVFREHKTPPRVVSDGERLLLDSAMSGDEPFMLASNLRD
ncbi:MAG: tetraacyldisaccharide 4'-kinase, partial [Kiritimatiellae bacterium]|nr:tetraacyldisaccharide 4'-kinase [Kiritimatiellia bacterium]